MTSPSQPPHAAAANTQGWWEAEGRRIAGVLAEKSAVVVIGSNAEHAALVAIGVARTESERRHVALGDLVGDLAPLYAIAGGEDAFGLSDCLRQGLPLNDIARPAPDRESLFILPAGSPPVAAEDVLGHERWPRLVNGFAKAGALLILVAPPGAPGLPALVAATGGVVLVEMAAGDAARFPVLATANAPAAPPVVRTRRGTPPWGVLALIAALLIGVAAWVAWKRAAISHGLRSGGEHVAPATPRAIKAPVAAARDTAFTPPPARQDTLRVVDPVNPGDTAATAPFAVEVMAANTLAGANSFLANNAKSATLAGATISPVPVGGTTNVWYKIIAGASHARTGADSLLAAMRRERVVRSGEGRVVQVPYALVLADNVERPKIDELIRSWRQRGFGAYALEQTDGSVRLLAGAFETPGEAATLATALAAAPAAPVIAFRTGRMH